MQRAGAAVAAQAAVQAAGAAAATGATCAARSTDALTTGGASTADPDTTADSEDDATRASAPGRDISPVDQGNIADTTAGCITAIAAVSGRAYSSQSC